YKHVLHNRYNQKNHETPAAPYFARSTEIALRRPDIEQPKAIVPAPERSKVMIAEPRHRPEAVRAQVEATRTLLDSLVEARQAFRARVADLDPVDGGERERVTTMIETYRAKSALDEALRRASTMMD